MSVRKFGIGNNQILSFMQSMEKSMHIALLYEDIHDARMIEYEFIQNGLKEGNTCIYIAENERDIHVIEREMEESGIDTGNFKRNNQLIISNREDFKQIFDNDFKFEQFSRIFSSSKNNLIRGVGTLTKPDLQSATGSISLEAIFHRSFSFFHGSWICHYKLESIEQQMDEKWVRDIFSNHHAVIFAPKLSNGLALHLPN